MRSSSSMLQNSWVAVTRMSDFQNASLCSLHVCVLDVNCCTVVQEWGQNNAQLLQDKLLISMLGRRTVWLLLGVPAAAPAAGKRPHGWTRVASFLTAQGAPMGTL